VDPFSIAWLLKGRQARQAQQARTGAVWNTAFAEPEQMIPYGTLSSSDPGRFRIRADKMGEKLLFAALRWPACAPFDAAWTVAKLSAM
jgi:hypothetical protein